MMYQQQLWPWKIWAILNLKTYNNVSNNSSYSTHIHQQQLRPYLENGGRRGEDGGQREEGGVEEPRLLEGGAGVAAAGDHDHDAGQDEESAQQLPAGVPGAQEEGRQGELPDDERL
jgi:hypothetical protein